MKQSILTCLFLLLSVLVFPQGEFNKWYFHDHAGLDFNSSPPVPLLNNEMFLGFNATVSISDSLGNLLFYSNGLNIFNRDHQIMPNGSWLLFGMNYSQPVFAVKQIGNDHLYYLFGLQWEFEVTPPVPPGLYYSVIDMDLNGGLGDVIPSMRNVPLSQAEDASDKLHATRHQNNRDVWLVTKKNSTHHYASFLINQSGINLVPVLSQSNVNDTSYPRLGSMKISQDGKKLAAGYIKLVDNFTPYYVAEFCNFNSTTGIITPLFCFRPVLGNDTLYPSDVEFSPDSKLLYITGEKDFGAIFKRGVFQYDATLNDSSLFMESQVFLGYTNDSLGTYGLQLAPDGKIYGTRPNIDSLSAINYPNIKGIACGFQENAISLNGKLSQGGLPQFLQKYKAYIHHGTISCMTDSISFSADIWPPPDSIHWDFGDPASGTANYSNLTSPAHLFSGPGNFTVEMWVRHIDKRTDTSWVSVNVLSSPLPELGNDTTVCTAESVAFDAGFCTGCTYRWTNLGSGLVVGTSQTFTTGIAGVYEAVVTDNNNCIGRDTVQLFVDPFMPVSVTISASVNPVCAGTLVALNAFAINGGSAPAYNWFVNGFPAGNDSQTYSYFPANGDCIICELNSNLPCTSGNPATSNMICMTVNPNLPVSVVVSASANPVCIGVSVTFTAAPTNGGITPVYQWYNGATLVGSNSDTYSYIPVNGDVITVVMTSNAGPCLTGSPATSNAVTMTVNPLLPASVTIAADANPVCAGTSVKFTATPVNGGTTPVYEWYNGAIPVGSNSDTYSYIPVDLDVITVVMTSNAGPCLTGSPATSNAVTMTVNPLLPASVTITVSANPVCAGISVTFTATPVNGGTSPAYTWKVNGGNAGSNSPNFSFSPQPGDSIWCIMTSNLSCVTSNPATSNKIAMVSSPVPAVTFTLCFDSITTINAKPIKLKGGIPLGGTYSGPGVNSISSVFTPSAAGIGTKAITYSYTNVALCSASKTKTIIVQSAPAFTCGNNLNDIRDGKVYPTLQLGSQCWMGSNLNYGTMILASSHQRDNCMNEKYCYQDLSANCNVQGANYQWDEIMRYDDTPGLQGLCPPAWHVPTEAEWNTLFANWTNNAFAGAPLKYSGYSGFNALLSGVRHQNVQWDYQNLATFFWSSTPYGAYKAWSHGMNDYDPSVAAYPAYRINAFSVRCIKDN